MNMRGTRLQYSPKCTRHISRLCARHINEREERSILPVYAATMGHYRSALVLKIFKGPDWVGVCVCGSGDVTLRFHGDGESGGAMGLRKDGREQQSKDDNEKRSTGAEHRSLSLPVHADLPERQEPVFAPDSRSRSVPPSPRKAGVCLFVPTKCFLGELVHVSGTIQ
ncbi:hypothetical protein NDU88_001446 [Pleurodeles waltl]|uniref:Uncharacterized protein n=1 Tax=Pleurodeles waltl TaxID=8319 RepID=A0AAV7THU1_PLEWA|nr:hypothetical protein NDU88_001446 [Pleurodeles waltl]